MRIAYSAEMFYADTGVEYLMIDYEGDTVDKTMRRMDRFATMVRPLVRAI